MEAVITGSSIISVLGLALVITISIRARRRLLKTVTELNLIDVEFSSKLESLEMGLSNLVESKPLATLTEPFVEVTLEALESTPPVGGPISIEERHEPNERDAYRDWFSFSDTEEDFHGRNEYRGWFEAGLFPDADHDAAHESPRPIGFHFGYELSWNPPHVEANSIGIMGGDGSIADVFLGFETVDSGICRHCQNAHSHRPSDRRRMATYIPGSFSHIDLHRRSQR
jgi:hypothetical protein